MNASVNDGNGQHEPRGSNLERTEMVALRSWVDEQAVFHLATFVQLGAEFTVVIRSDGRRESSGSGTTSVARANLR